MNPREDSSLSSPRRRHIGEEDFSWVHRCARRYRVTYPISSSSLLSRATLITPSRTWSASTIAAYTSSSSPNLSSCAATSSIWLGTGELRCGEASHKPTRPSRFKAHFLVASIFRGVDSEVPAKLTWSPSARQSTSVDLDRLDRVVNWLRYTTVETGAHHQEDNEDHQVSSAVPPRPRTPVLQATPALTRHGWHRTNS
jgi:hypothetical protein